MSYRCENCGERFSFPSIEKESHGLGGPWGELLEVCPCCKVPGMMVEVRGDAGFSY